MTEPSVTLRQRIAEFAEGILSLWYPPVCVVCGSGVSEGNWCERCRQWMQAAANAPACSRCAASIGPFVESERGCDLCRTESFAFSRAFRLGRYHEQMAEICIRMKHNAGILLARACADVWIERFRDAAADVDLIVPVPMHWTRRWPRGYNQSEAIADQIAWRLGKPCLKRSLVRVRATAQQASLAPSRRRENVRRAFAVRSHSRLRGARVLLVDDILTTGATCHECAKVLKSAGSIAVAVAMIARGDNVAR